MPTGAFVARRNGKVFATGNSGFPKGKGNLKPAWEPIILCRKPGAKVRPLGIDECRIGTEKTVTLRHGHSGDNGVYGRDNRTFTRENPGRWPANVILDEEAAGMVDEQSGVSKSTGGRIRSGATGRSGIYGVDARVEVGDPGYGDSGGASRFFYCPKASRSERNAGCEGLEARVSLSMPGRRDPDNAEWDTGNDVTSRFVTKRQNHHPTVKPVALMSWLVKLICPPGGTVLDPFMGSGTTGIACAKEGRDFIGIERDADYYEIARRRIEAAESQLQLAVTT